MAKRRRTSSRIRAAEARPTGEAPSAEAGPPPIDPDVARFAARVQEQREADKAQKQAARRARQREEEGARLVVAKDAAAAELKRLRGQPRVSAEELATADAAYRQALAAVITAETGAAPRWATVSDPEAPSGIDHQATEETSVGDTPAADDPAADDPEPGSDG